MRRRGRSGFEPVGRVEVDSLGLTGSRSRQLALATAWREVAGEEVAARAQAIRVLRGVLEIDVADPRWAETLAPMIPRLAGRLVARHPGLGVKKFRVLRGAGRKDPAQPVESDDEPAPPETRLRTETAEPRAAIPGGDVGQRLEALMRNYLQRGGDQKP